MTTAGIHLRCDAPFTRGDQSYRVIPSATPPQRILPESALRRMVGAIILAMLALSVVQKTRRIEARGHDSVYGIPAGFATTVANAAGPVMNLYLLSRKLPKEEFVATAAWFFQTVNLSKVPIYAGYGL